MFDGYFETIENEKKIVKKIIDNDDYEILLQFSRGVNSLFVPFIYKENMVYSNIFYILHRLRSAERKLSAEN